MSGSHINRVIIREKNMVSIHNRVISEIRFRKIPGFPRLWVRKQWFPDRKTIITALLQTRLFTGRFPFPFLFILPLYFVFIFYLPRFTLPDFLSIYLRAPCNFYFAVIELQRSIMQIGCGLIQSPQALFYNFWVIHQYQNLSLISIYFWWGIPPIICYSVCQIWWSAAET